MKRARLIRRVILIVLLVAVLALMGLWYLNFRATKKLSFDFTPAKPDTINAPQYFYSFAGTEKNHLEQPIGVLAVGDRVYVTDAKLGEVFIFNARGNLIKTFGRALLQNPLYIAQNPKTKNLYISDRGKRQLYIFDLDGKNVGTFDPKLPKKQLPKFDTHGVQWIPIALDFASDGSLYVTEILNGHRLLVFGPDGKFRRSVGEAAIVYKADQGPNLFQFPNSVKVHKDEVWVVDSNNRRVQVFDLAGNFKRFIPTAGLPRGLSFLPRFSNDNTSTPDRAVIVDTLAHDATIWNTAGENLVNFGQQGTLEGQFNFPTDVSVGQKSLIFITDTNNIRVEVWGWPEKVSLLPPLRIPQRWGWCLTPLLLLPLLLLRRKRQYVATADFVYAMIDAEQVHLMANERVKWLVRQEDYDEFDGKVVEGVALGELLQVSEYSDSDARSIMERLEVEYEPAVVLSMAQRAKGFCTEDGELRRLARALEVEVMSSVEFMEKYAAKAKKARV